MAGVLVSCEGEDKLDMIDHLAAEKEALHAFLSTHAQGSVTPVPVFNKWEQLIDSLFIYNNDATGTVADSGNVVLYDYSLRRLDGSFIDAGVGYTSEDPLVTGDTVLYALGGPVYYFPEKSRNYDYLGSAFRHIGEGKSGEMLIPSILLDRCAKTRHYELQVRRVISDLFAYEKELIAYYFRLLDPVQTYKVAAKGASATTDTLAYAGVTTAGSSGLSLAEGDTLTLYYSSFLLDEVHLTDGGGLRTYALDTVRNTPFATKNFAYEAFGGLLTQLHEGDVAYLILPYALGQQGTATYLDKDKKVVLIPSYATLGFRVEVAEIRKVAEKPDPDPDPDPNPDPDPDPETLPDENRRAGVEIPGH